MEGGEVRAAARHGGAGVRGEIVLDWEVRSVWFEMGLMWGVHLPS